MVGKHVVDDKDLDGLAVDDVGEDAVNVALARKWLGGRRGRAAKKPTDDVDQRIDEVRSGLRMPGGHRVYTVDYSGQTLEAVHYDEGGQQTDLLSEKRAESYELDTAGASEADLRRMLGDTGNTVGLPPTNDGVEPAGDKPKSVEAKESLSLLQKAEFLLREDRARHPQEGFPGERLLRVFPILFADTDDLAVDRDAKSVVTEVERQAEADKPPAKDPASLGDCGLSLLAVYTDEQERGHGEVKKIEGLPGYVSALATLPLTGKKGQISYFAVPQKRAEELVKTLTGRNSDRGCVVASTNHGVYATKHAAGVSVLGQGLTGLEGEILKKKSTPAALQARKAAVPRTKTVSFEAVKPAQAVDLDNQGIERELPVNRVETPEQKTLKNGFLAQVAVACGDVRTLKLLHNEFAALAREQGCFVQLKGNVFRVFQFSEKPTGVGLTVANFSKKVVEKGYAFRAKIVSGELKTKITGYTSAPQVVGPGVKHLDDFEFYDLLDEGGDNLIFVDGKVQQFDWRLDNRQFDLGMETIKHADISERLGRDVFIACDFKSLENKQHAMRIREFVGRKKETQHVESTVEKARAGLQFGLVIGPGGSGKSTLLAHALPDDSIVVVGRGLQDLTCVKQIASALVEKVDAYMQGRDLEPYNSSVRYLREFIGQGEEADLQLNDDSLVDALVNVLELLSHAAQAYRHDIALWLDDVDYFGLRSSQILKPLLAKLAQDRGKYKNISVWATLRSDQRHVRKGTDEGNLTDQIINKYFLRDHDNLVEVSEFFLAKNVEGKIKIADWFDDFVGKRIWSKEFNKDAPTGLKVDHQIADVCRMMASGGIDIHNKETRVSPYVLKSIIDLLVDKGFLLIDRETGLIKLRDFAAARQAVESGELPLGPQAIYNYQYDRLREENPNYIKVLYIMLLLKGVDVRLIAALADQFEAEIPGFAGLFQELSGERGILNPGATVDMHSLWEDVLEDKLKVESQFTGHLKAMVFGILKGTKEKRTVSGPNAGSIARMVNTQQIFALAIELNDVQSASKYALIAANDALKNFNYQAAVECADYALSIQGTKDDYVLKAKFLKAKAFVALDNFAEAKPLLKELLPKASDLPESLRVEVPDLYLDNAESYLRHCFLDERGEINNALDEYDKVLGALRTFIKLQRTQRKDTPAVRSWQTLVDYHTASVLYYRCFRGAFDPQKHAKQYDFEPGELQGKDHVGYRKCLSLCEQVLGRLDSLGGESSAELSPRAKARLQAQVHQVQSAVCLELAKSKSGGDSDLLALRALKGRHVAFARSRGHETAEVGDIGDEEIFALLGRAYSLGSDVLKIAHQLHGIKAAPEAECKVASFMARVAMLCGDEQHVVQAKDTFGAYAAFVRLRLADEGRINMAIAADGRVNVDRACSGSLRRDLEAMVRDQHSASYREEPNRPYNRFNYAAVRIKEALSLQPEEAKIVLKDALENQILHLRDEKTWAYPICVLLSQHALVAAKHGCLDDFKMMYGHILYRLGVENRDPRKVLPDLGEGASAAERELYEGKVGLTDVSDVADLTWVGRKPSMDFLALQTMKAA